MEGNTLFLPQSEFSKRLDDFKQRHDMSFADLARLCNNEPNTSSATLFRLTKGQLKTDVYERVVPSLEKYLEAWMEEQGFEIEEIKEELEKLGYKERIMIIKRCELISTAVKFFGLDRDPFDVDRIPSDDELFSSGELDEIAMRMKDAVLYKRFCCLVGRIGSGKTSMKIRIARELMDVKQEVRLIYPEFFDMNSLSVGSIASYILEEFDVKVPRSSPARVKKIKEQLTSMDKDDIRVALVFDECHRLNERVLVSLKNFWEMTNGGYNRLLGVVLFGQPKFIQATLRDVRFREIAERVQVLELPNFSKVTEDYLRHKISAAGGDADQLFDKDSIKRICANSRTPLAIGNLANTALMEAFRLEEKQVVSSMLDLPDQPRKLRAA